MISTIKSLWIWLVAILLMVVWVPLLATVRLFDRDPARYRTGRMFRRLGAWLTRINPGWEITRSGRVNLDDRHPYVVVGNHLSNADIPVISTLPWEMKWVAKKELFGLPVVGWMMKMAGDIPVDRGNPRSQVSTLKRSMYYLRHDCSVMFFPEGTRSRTGRLGSFTNGAFHLAIREQLPVVPLVVDGTQTCLPKRSWKFGEAPDIRLKVLDPVPTEGLDDSDVDELTEKVRSLIRQQLDEWRRDSRP